MIGVLRVVRGIAGFLFLMQIITLLPAISWLQDIHAVTDALWVKFIIKLLVLVVAGGLFFWLRSVINTLYTKKHAAPHPALVSRWGL